MDFFENQEAARRKTSVLVFYFVLAVVGMIAALYFVAIAIFGMRSKNDFELWQPGILLLSATGTILVIALGSTYKSHQLRGGGESIAVLLGGRLLHPSTTDRFERRLLNVVEEMALASGTPVPAVYLLDDEKSINAFAAGHTPGDAVIGINQGTLDTLSRDELQGVIAHEFSHILNGDMRLNLRLVGILHGILMLALIGYYTLRFAGVGTRHRSNGRSNGRQNGGQLILLGIAMLAIGYLGLFFARLIKAAVSRQREYLADASAVQFTRNPAGIAGALKKIGGLAAGSRMTSPEAETASHMFFGNSRGTLLQLFSTHPPLVKRIQRIDAGFDGIYPSVQSLTNEPTEGKKRELKKDAEKSPLDPLLRTLGAAGMGNHFPIDPVVVAATIGAPDTTHVVYAKNLLAQLPDALTQAVHDTFSGRAIVLAMLLDDDPAIRTRQLEIVADTLDEPTRLETIKLRPLVESQGVAARLPLAELVQRTLHGLSPTQYGSFRKTVVELAQADGKIDLFEFSLQRGLIRRLDHHFRRTKPPATVYLAIGALVDEISDLISALTHFGHSDEAAARNAFEQAVVAAGLSKAILQRNRSDCSLKSVAKALDKLAQASPPIKKRVLHAATVGVMTDGQITLVEAELLRTIADSLDCPMPPLT